MMDPARAVFFIPANLRKFKLDLFNRIGATIEKKGGRVVRGDFAALSELRDHEVPIVGCTPELRPLIEEWKSQGRDWVYWDRGYARRVFATCLPTGAHGGYYRWHFNSFQMETNRDVPGDRWKALNTPLTPWRKNGKHIVIAAPTKTYCRFHRCEDWIADTIHELSRYTGRQFVIRDKEQYLVRPIQADLEGAHCLVTHGSNAAVEAVILGCPVFVDKTSAAALVGSTELRQIERPVYPDREPWVRSLAYCQVNEAEMTNGRIWDLLA